MENIFENKQLRSLYDKTENKYWFSAIDICSALIGGDYAAGQKYWHDFKYNRTKRKGQFLVNYEKLKFPSANGTYKYTEVLDIQGLIYLIQTIPSPKADPYRLWLADVLINNTPIESTLAAQGESFAKEVMAEYKKRPTEMGRVSQVKENLL